MSDIHSFSPAVKVPIVSVGVKGVRERIKILSKKTNDVISQFVKIDLFIDLPAELRGIHMSRCNEVINEVVQEQLKNPKLDYEGICEEIAKRSLIRHEYASVAEATMQGNYVIEKRTPVTEKPIQEVYEIIARALVKKTNEGVIITRKSLGVIVIGNTACPCGQELVRNYISRKLSNKIKDKELKALLSVIPLATHIQRTIVNLTMELPVNYDIEPDDLIEIAEKSMSTSTYEVLKREDEEEVIVRMLMKTKFVEDVIRTIALKLVEHFRHLPGQTMVHIKVTSQESVHKHDAYSVLLMSLKKMRELLLKE